MSVYLFMPLAVFIVIIIKTISAKRTSIAVMFFCAISILLLGSLVKPMASSYIKHTTTFHNPLKYGFSDYTLLLLCLLAACILLIVQMVYKRREMRSNGTNSIILILSVIAVFMLEYSLFDDVRILMSDIVIDGIISNKTILTVSILSGVALAILLIISLSSQSLRNAFDNGLQQIIAVAFLTIFVVLLFGRISEIVNYNKYGVISINGNSFTTIVEPEVRTYDVPDDFYDSYKKSSPDDTSGHVYGVTEGRKFIAAKRPFFYTEYIFVPYAVLGLILLLKYVKKEDNTPAQAAHQNVSFNQPQPIIPVPAKSADFAIPPAQQNEHLPPQPNND